jgi:tetratricopeptide (TPR) repeat protein
VNNNSMADRPPISKDLDTEELMHLALTANQAGDHENSILYLKEVLKTEPDHGYALYLLGAQHAQLKMFARAIEEIARAIEVEPEIPATAHFQLGLLYLTSGAVPEAMMAWAPLDALGENDALFVFKRGLVHMIQDEFPECIENLERGIQINALYPALNKDMQMFADKAREAMLGKGPVPTRDAAAPTEPVPASRSADLSAYRSDSDD